MTWIPTNNARHIPVHWFTSPMRLIPVKKSPVPSLVIDQSLQGAERPTLQPFRGVAAHQWRSTHSLCEIDAPVNGSEPGGVAHATA